jgi:hypothetical protein
MPYIKKSERRRIEDELELGIVSPSTPGDLNYIITKILHEYVDLDECYQRYNDVVGVLECAKLELYRRKVAKYEDKKIKENGDV